MRSSGGGTGTTTGQEEDVSLFTSSTLMGPVILFRCIWYFFTPLGTCKTSRGSATRQGRAAER